MYVLNGMYLIFVEWPSYLDVLFRMEGRRILWDTDLFCLFLVDDTQKGKRIILPFVLTYFIHVYMYYLSARGSVVFEALCYNTEGRGFDSRRGHWIFQLT
jgi:hypothetical protein